MDYRFYTVSPFRVYLINKTEFVNLQYHFLW